MGAEKAPPRGVWLAVADLLLVVEIMSPGSEAMDEVTKRGEYALITWLRLPSQSLGANAGSRT